MSTVPIFSLSPSKASTPARMAQYTLQNPPFPPGAPPLQWSQAQAPAGPYSFPWGPLPPGPPSHPPPPPQQYPPFSYAAYQPPQPVSFVAAASPAPKASHQSSKENFAPLPSSKTPKRKRGAERDNNAHAKRIQKDYDKAEAAARIPPPSECGVGPSETISTTPHRPSRQSTAPAGVSSGSAGVMTLPPPRQRQNPFIERAASQGHRGQRGLSDQGPKVPDVWPFVYGLDSCEQHDVPVSGGAKGHPKTSYLGCKLCIDSGSWKVYRNSNNGVTSNLRKHLRMKHKDDWQKFCLASGYLGDVMSRPGSSLQSSDNVGTAIPFSFEKFQEYLVDWVAADDQAVNVIECLEFRRLLIFISPSLSQDTILHRRKLTDLIYGRYQVVHQEILDALQRTPGRVSCTFDGWSNKGLESFLAVTAHHVVKNAQQRLELKSHLLAFRRMEGEHNGDNIGGTFFRVVKEARLLGKLGLVSTDNASSNGTAFKRIELDFASIDVAFDAEGNRIGCFPHSAALGTGAFMSEIKDNPREPILKYANSLSDPAERERARKYAEALAADPVGRIRALVAACRASGQRRDDLQAVIKNGNEAKQWERIRPGGMPALQLLRDCPTRWSSTYNMIDRVLVLYPAIESFLSLPKHVDIAHHALSETEIQVLEDIHDVLEKSSDVQQALSGEQTPTVAFTFPTYEALVTSLTELSLDIPIIQHYIKLNILKVKQYSLKCRRSRIFALAMLLRPDTKINNFATHLGWSREEAEQAKEWMIEAMVAHRTASRHRFRRAQSNSNPVVSRAITEPQATPTLPPALPIPDSHASDRAAPRFTSRRHLRKLEELSATKGHPGNKHGSTTASSNQNSETSNPTTPTTCNEEQIEAAEVIHDRAMCEREFNEFQNEPIVHISHGDDLLVYWSDKEHTKPFLYLVALDVLPAQASSVSCERVFSSSKETDAARRNRTDPSLMEVLQVIKYHCKQNRPAFRYMDELAPAKEEDYTIEGPVTDAARRELAAAGQFDELNELIANSY